MNEYIFLLQALAKRKPGRKNLVYMDPTTNLEFDSDVFNGATRTSRIAESRILIDTRTEKFRDFMDDIRVEEVSLTVQGHPHDFLVG